MSLEEKYLNIPDSFIPHECTHCKKSLSLFFYLTKASFQTKFINVNTQFIKLTYELLISFLVTKENNYLNI